MKPEEVQLLIDELIDGSISETDAIRIEAELLVDENVRAAYYRRIQMDYLLRREAAGIEPELEPPRIGDDTKDHRGIRSAMITGILIGLACSVLVVVSLCVYGVKHGLFGQDRIATTVPSEPSANGYAILKGQSDAVWASDSIVVGDLVPGGPLHLESGRVHLEFFSGVQMVIEGNAQFAINSPMQVTMHSGRARARVPEPAQGFVVKTSSGDIVDLGTEFSLDVNETGADVRVITGEVELRPKREKEKILLGGAALRIGSSGLLEDASNVDLEMISPNDFRDLVRLQRQGLISKWGSETENLTSDPRLVAFYRFSEDQMLSREVNNLASSDQSASDGAIVAAELASDRWGRLGKAIDFSRIGSSVRVDVPGEMRGVTMNCWVKINSLDRWYNSLFLTDAHEDREPHWQIMDDGRVFFSVKLPTPDGVTGPETQCEFYSPPIWDASLSGRWVMLSVTYDVDAKQVTHFLNGQPLITEDIPDHGLIESIKVGRASICNWSEPRYLTDAEWVVRNLNGSMDEFAMYAGALSADEISHLYQIGNPDGL